ncbi:MAG: hypothetical protein ABSC56_03035 [Solirubrobacteraceae bacterium]|jgi:CHASE1-domain containing sensor protein
MGETMEASADRPVPSSSPEPVETPVRRFRIWLVVAVLVAGVGVAGSALAARSAANSNAEKSREAFEQSSAEVAASLQLALDRERDLVITASGLFLGDPTATGAQFRAWATSVQALQRYPELLTWGEILLVRRADLAAFAARFVPAGSRRAFPRCRQACGRTTALPRQSTHARS